MTNDFISLFQSSTKQYPNKVALQFFSEQLTYQQLDSLSDQIAISILNQGIPFNSPIMLEVEKSLASVVYILGILKAGCYYIPIASNIPIKRFHYLRENSQCSAAFLSNCHQECSAIEDFNCFLIEKDLSKIINSKENKNSNVCFPEIKPTDPACCLYTSGSTGYPKGVLMSHNGIAAFFRDVIPCMTMNHNSVCLNTAPFIFDVSIVDTLFPLSLGATIHLSPEPLLPNIILKIIQDNRITHMSGVSSTINLLFGNSELLTKYDISSLKTIMTGAELLHQKTLSTIIGYSPSATIINGYGLTETTCACTAFIVNRDNVYDYVLYPIGKPLAGVEAKILFTEPTEDNRGELLLSGEQIMLEYLNNPEATNKVFVEHEGKRFLRTGDIVSYDEDNNFIFHGRNDTQIKIYGYRVDLNEIKYSLLSMKTIKEAEVLLLDSTITAVLSLHGKSESVDEEALLNDLKKALNDFLPKYAHPKKWVFLKDLPKLPTGKTNLKKLRTDCIDSLI